ncbi:hypothetical protein BYT27DRAFT_7220545 [Phlegmacium glaucopus]|nr:hypothetical protein BYT27DRAFT_7220545 [Phlegmacium glaucopus]
MIPTPLPSRQPLREACSALNSYLSFVRIHNFPVEPTPETLSFFTVYMSHHINPQLVASYLSGISQQLEPYFPSVQVSHCSPLVEHTLKGCMHIKGVSTKQKCALTISDLECVICSLQNSSNHNNSLFLSMLLTGFFALLWLGELVFPDNKDLQNWCKISKHSSVIITHKRYKFQLPSHKADQFFKGSRILVTKTQFPPIDPLSFFQRYLTSRDLLFPLVLPLWLTSTSAVPNRCFFITHIHSFFRDSIRGHLMCAGGATSLAEHGVPPSIIQPMGRWSSNTFLIYIRKNPVLIIKNLFGWLAGQRAANRKGNNMYLPKESN